VNSNMIVGRNPEDGVRHDKFSYGDQLRTKSPVYFNSNDYLGCNHAAERDKIVSVQSLQQNPARLLMFAEEKLLRSLVEYAPARKAMKMAIKTNLKSNGSNDLIEWSCSERKWLFEKLVGGDLEGAIPRELLDGGTVSQLRDLLKGCKDVPGGAFEETTIRDSKQNGFDGSQRSTESGMIKRAVNAVIDVEPVNTYPSDSRMSAFDVGRLFEENVQQTRALPYPMIDESPDDGYIALEDLANEQECRFDLEGISPDPKRTIPGGSLDMFFFRQADDLFSDSVFTNSSSSHETRADLIVQETLATILRATAMKNLARVKDAWRKTKTALLAVTKGDVIEDVAYDSENNYKTEINELQKDVIILEAKLNECVKTATELDNAARRIGARLLDYSLSGGMGRASVMQEEMLAKTVDEYVANLPDDVTRTRGDDGNYIFGSDEYDEHINPLNGGEKFRDTRSDDGRDSVLEPSDLGHDDKNQSIFEFYDDDTSL